MDTLIPYDDLPAETLVNIIDDIVSRDGTDYGAYDLSVEDKRRQVMSLLKRKEAVLLFDTESETIRLVSKAEMQRGFQ
ncbi:YheU family protein [Maribrevibacterium harenarium]|uniref:YheU family protein n=1 Tax=Maribrevibacterium harenarium TaxID=2589817 RepID=A0A501X2M2_9GAMM|nr:YheU family protein [Maribrevibacterium harenarium]TPE54738.1 YheU family protein [Maribrevibacterium harenarium]